MKMFRDWVDRGYVIPLKMLKVTLNALPPLIKALVKHPIYIAKSNREADENPPTYGKPSYEIPEYEPGMKYCKSNEKYLRPTHLCNPHAKEIIALANKLGAYQVD
ncbi:MAG: hypothetical protein DRN11_01020 [Thermoplasmata archaeon]|nr:MAG: hypothetical protein DRN11_01020 [Thermoplasmata archaeon]